MCDNSNCSTASLILGIESLFNFSHSVACVMQSHGGFNLHFSEEKLCLELFYTLFGHLDVFFCEMSIQGLCPFLIGLSIIDL